MPDTKADRVGLARRALSHLEKPVTARAVDDYAPFFELLAEDVCFEHASPTAAGVLHGKQKLVDYVTSWFGELADARRQDDVEVSRPLEYFQSGDRVVVLWAERTIDKESRRPGPSTEAVAVFDFDGEHIVRLRKFSQ
ncbi:hypothetical protein BAY59_22795 [Prauserella coralliicola]|nr:hypothetical protein BAY59_22795 [Prauserella coralliicola]